MTALSTPIIANVYCWDSIAALNTTYLPKKPPVGGMPAIENMKKLIASASIGRDQPSPAHSLSV